MRRSSSPASGWANSPLVTSTILVLLLVAVHGDMASIAKGKETCAAAGRRPADSRSVLPSCQAVGKAELNTVRTAIKTRTVRDFFSCRGDGRRGCGRCVGRGWREWMRTCAWRFEWQG